MILLNKKGLILLLLNLLFVFKDNGSKHRKIFKKSTYSFWPYVPYSFHVTCFVDFISFELNPGPKHNAAQTLSICHWNLSSISAHNFGKSYLLRVYVSVHKFDRIFLSEKYLDSSVDDESLEISGYYLTRSDHPSNKKRGGICIYYKNFLPLKVTGVRLLEECIAFDLIISNKLCSFIALYRPPSQSQDSFVKFSDNFEMTLDLSV